MEMMKPCSSAEKLIDSRRRTTRRPGIAGLIWRASAAPPIAEITTVPGALAPGLAQDLRQPGQPGQSAGDRLPGTVVHLQCPGRREPRTCAPLSSAATAPDRNIPGSPQAGRAQLVCRCNQNGTQMARRAPILTHRPGHSEFLHGDRLPVTCRRRSCTRPQGNGNDAASSLDRDKAGASLIAL
jgi:hypothetical protein